MLLRAATADAAAIFSLKVLAERFKAVGISFILFTLSMAAKFGLQRPNYALGLAMSLFLL